MSDRDRVPSVRELKLTAALYAKRNGVLDYVRETGLLPEMGPMGGASIAMRLLIQERGTDIELTPDEQMVFDAILKGDRLPGGAVVLLDEEG